MEEQFCFIQENGIRRQTDRLLVDMDAPPQEGEQETTGGGGLA